MASRNKFAIPTSVEGKGAVLLKLTNAQMFTTARAQRDCLTMLLRKTTVDIYAATHNVGGNMELEISATMEQISAAQGGGCAVSLAQVSKVFKMCLQLGAANMTDRFCKLLLVGRLHEGDGVLPEERIQELWEDLERDHNAHAPTNQRVSKALMVRICNLPAELVLAPPWSYRGYARYQFLDPLVNGPHDQRDTKEAIPLPPALDRLLMGAYPNPPGMKATGFKPKASRSPKKKL